ncbi:MAG: hypothetical protein AB1631_09285, partial [Acidobacteriota bacterium]
EVPPALARVVSRCLEKAPQERFQSITDVAFCLEEASRQSDSFPASMPAQSRPSNRGRFAWMLMAVAALVAIFFILYLQRAPSDTAVMRFIIPPPENVAFVRIEVPVISPDGRRLAFVATDSAGKTMLWIRALDSIAAQPLPATEGARHPFWSPDSRHIGFFANKKLRRIDVTSGAAQVICDAEASGTGTWNSEDVIVFAPGWTKPLHRVSAGGGVPAPVTSIDESRQEASHRWPHFLPDGRHFLYKVMSHQHENEAVNIGSLDGQESRRLLTDSSAAIYAPPGYLMFVREGALMAQAFDASKMQLTGEPFSVIETIASPGQGQGMFSVSETGVLAYRSGGAQLNIEFAWLDRTGKRVGGFGPPDHYFNASLSLDEKSIAFQRTNPRSGSDDIWILDITHGASSRITFGPESDAVPVWSPDSSRIVFASRRGDQRDLSQIQLRKGEEFELLLKTDADKFPEDWSRDGRFISYRTRRTRDESGDWDLWILSLSDRKPFLYLQTQYNERSSKFSPDGKWIAYASDESGRYEVYVRPFPSGAGKWKVSTAGGSQPGWRPDGKELFYLSEDWKLMSVELSGASALAPGVPRPLFNVPRTSLPNYFDHSYFVSAYGKRFLIGVPVDDSRQYPINVVVNWMEGLKR